MHTEDTEVERAADPSDVATQQELLALQSARITSRQPEGPKPTMECLFCGGPLDGVRRWCDAECRDGWQAYQARVGR